VVIKPRHVTSLGTGSGSRVKVGTLHADNQFRVFIFLLILTHHEAVHNPGKCTTYPVQVGRSNRVDLSSISEVRSYITEWPRFFGPPCSLSLLTMAGN